MLSKVEPEDRQFVKKNLAISKQVRHILANHPTISTQKALAEALGKEPSEISKWLSGLHNIGLENITKMETVLGQDIILTDEQAREKYTKTAKDNYHLIATLSFAGETKFPIEYLKKKQFAIINPKNAHNKEKGMFELAY
jgi:transcriptional regulator with XRE-family HTH domain